MPPFVIQAIHNIRLYLCVPPPISLSVGSERNQGRGFRGCFVNALCLALDGRSLERWRFVTEVNYSPLDVDLA